MKLIEGITVKVTYQVGLGSLEVADEMYNALKKCHKDGDIIDLSDYSKLRDWLTSNIQERDCCEWEAEIEEFN